MVDIVLPDEAWTDVEEGAEAVLGEWLVAVGDRVASGQVIGTVHVMKATVDLVAPAAGIVASLEVGPEENIRRGQVIARLAPG